MVLRENIRKKMLFKFKNHHSSKLYWFFSPKMKTMLQSRFEGVWTSLQKMFMTYYNPDKTSFEASRVHAQWFDIKTTLKCTLTSRSRTKTREWKTGSQLKWVRILTGFYSRVTSWRENCYLWLRNKPINNSSTLLKN